MPDSPDARRRAVNTVFGEVLPETSADERELPSSEDNDRHDRWLRDNIPPHHE
jgi:hypothetical protein